MNKREMRDWVQYWTTVIIVGGLLCLWLGLAAWLKGLGDEVTTVVTPEPAISQRGPDIRHCFDESAEQPLWDCIRFKNQRRDDL